ncbi:ESX secretion-associated protein EspG [Nocardia yamanashiensis]|uniref:ESX secretion-associated protein EspG n=1 Tax=Nocardia yamanashiensis TaxID=209247 RepID=UPI001E4C9435|nr:ESX secretion-associated protein EspG [Nocardia yamanashiensis]UGT39673.1 ESX secretion-associated protein EspG [Nocardia yamanashiensis]
MSRHWRFGDLEFTVLWEMITGDDLPAPLIFTSRTPLRDDYFREKREMVEQLRSKWDYSVDALADVIEQPDLRVIVSGVDGRDERRADGRIRMIALRRGDRGLLIKQLPGETYSHSGGFTVRECDPVRLADEVAAALPETDAGRQGNTPLADPSAGPMVEPQFDRLIIDDIFADSATLRSKKFLAITPMCMGTIEVRQGHSKFGPKGMVSHSLQWRDLEDDGRYVIRREPPYVAVPADSKQLIASINVCVAAVIRAIKDERGTLQP